jgi:hypothetical protein
MNSKSQNIKKSVEVSTYLRVDLCIDSVQNAIDKCAWEFAVNVASNPAKVWNFVYGSTRTLVGDSVWSSMGIAVQSKLKSYDFKRKD